MWKKNYSEIYQTIQSFPTWPKHLKNIMKLILESTRQRVIELISKAYSSIRLGDASKLLGLSEEEAINLAGTLNWSYEVDTGFLMINQRDTSAQQTKSGQTLLGIDNGTELLERLTDYIIFLESTK